MNPIRNLEIYIKIFIIVIESIDIYFIDYLSKPHSYQIISHDFVIYNIKVLPTAHLISPTNNLYVIDNTVCRHSHNCSQLDEALYKNIY